MRVFSIQNSGVTESYSLDGAVIPEQGYLWISCARDKFIENQVEIQAALLRLCNIQLVDLHIADLLNAQIPSHYDYTSQYDVLIFRRLAPSSSNEDFSNTPSRAHKGGTPILKKIDTNPVGFAVLDQILLTVHPNDCGVRDSYAEKLLIATSAESRAAGARPPTTPADLMLRITNQMVDGFLELRRELTRQLDHWQAELLDPRSHFSNWSSLLDARLTLHHLDEICEDQRAAIQDWIEAIKTWPEPTTPSESRDRELLQVRSRDVLEHIERVVQHVHQLEQSTESAVQMHFNAQGHRTNDIMRTLTSLTAIFLPLNLIAAIFGMNFDSLPLIHTSQGFWLAMGSMGVIATILGLVFWRKKYLARGGR